MCVNVHTDASGRTRLGDMTRVGPHLTSHDDVKCCSVCGKEFPPDSKPSISKAFVAHVRAEHKSRVAAEQKDFGLLQETKPKTA